MTQLEGEKRGQCEVEVIEIEIGKYNNETRRSGRTTE